MNCVLLVGCSLWFQTVLNFYNAIFKVRIIYYRCIPRKLRQSWIEFFDWTSLQKSRINPSKEERFGLKFYFQYHRFAAPSKTFTHKILISLFIQWILKRRIIMIMMTLHWERLLMIVTNNDHNLMRLQAVAVVYIYHILFQRLLSQSQSGTQWHRVSERSKIMILAIISQTGDKLINYSFSVARPPL